MISILICDTLRVWQFLTPAECRGQSIRAIIDAHLILKGGLGMQTQVNNIGSDNEKNFGNGFM
jgi:hypothetical protein